MPSYCAVIKCGNSRKSDVDKSFYRLPAVVTRLGPQKEKLSRERRGKWLANISRADLTPSGEKYLRVCSDHFISGKPAKLEDTDHPDWAPSQKLGHNKVTRKSGLWYSRLKRIEEREKKGEAAAALMTIYTKTSERGAPQETQVEKCDCPTHIHGQQVEEDNQIGLSSSTRACQTEMPALVTTGCQTDETVLGLRQQQDDMQYLRIEVLELRAKVKSQEMSEESFKGDDAKVAFYTGLRNYEMLMYVFNFISKITTPAPRCILTPFQEFILFVMHLHLNHSFQYLAYSFRVSLATVTRIFAKWVDLTDSRLKVCIRWPAREELMSAMPTAFHREFGDRVLVILDCFEIKMNTRSSLSAQAATLSPCKNNTTKFLIGISPSGHISFVSRGWGGRVSDKTITENSSILENLLPGDIVLAGRGFGIEESVGLYCASLARPVATKGKPQLSSLEIENTRKLANIKMHVEKIIGLVQRKYAVLQGPLPVELLKSEEGTDMTRLDKIVRICCSLVNLSSTIVPLDEQVIREKS